MDTTKAAGMDMYEDTLAFIHAITKLLNQSPDSNDFYIDVRLRETDTHRVMGWWSDEAGNDHWAFIEGGGDRP